MEKRMTSPPRSPAAVPQGDSRIDFSFLLGDVTRLLRRAYDQEMEAIGLTRSQWHLLVYVIRLERPTQTQLAEALDIARPSVGTLIDHLESTGYVSRVRDAGDRRVWRIIPTRLAIQRAEEFERAAERVASQAFDSVARNDLTKATALLLTISDNLKS
ncbi:MAG: hypothetical protein B7X53_11310 [Hyphomonas sp. 34-62-18]|nr:MAG: hypothetical protein B7X53_11310 [Hyphomonas sp. 34-62-18]